MAKVTKAESLARQAEAAAKAEEAKARGEAAKAEAQSKQAETERQQRKDKQEADAAAAKQKAETEAADAQRAREEDAAPYRIGSNLAALPVGIVAGHQLAKNIEVRELATVAARNAEIANLAAETRDTLSGVKDGKTTRGQSAKLKASVAAAHRVGVPGLRPKGKFGAVGAAVKAFAEYGGVPAGILLAEGGLSRFVIAPSIENEKAQAVVSALGSASVFAATNLIGERAIQKFTPPTLPDSNDLAVIEEAKTLSEEPPKAASRKAPAGPKAAAAPKPTRADLAANYKAAFSRKPPTDYSTKTILSALRDVKIPPVVGKIAAGASRAILPVAAVAVGIAAAVQSAEAGESSVDVAKAGGGAVADLMTGGAVSEYEAAKADGKSDTLAVVSGVLGGVANVLTLGLSSVVGDLVKSAPIIATGGEETQRDKVAAEAAGLSIADYRAGRKNAPQGKAYLNGGAAAKAAAAPAARANAVAAAPVARSDGQTEGYTRTGRGGLVVKVKAYATPKR